MTADDPTILAIRIALLIFNAIMWAIAGGYVARGRGQDAAIWGWVSLFIGPFAILILLFMGEKHAHSCANCGIPYEHKVPPAECKLPTSWVCKVCQSEADAGSKSLAT